MHKKVLLVILSFLAFCFDVGVELRTAKENQTDAEIAYLMFDARSGSFRLTADSISAREKYICQFSGRPL